MPEPDSLLARTEAWLAKPSPLFRVPREISAGFDLELGDQRRRLCQQTLVGAILAWGGFLLLGAAVEPGFAAAAWRQLVITVPVWCAAIWLLGRITTPQWRERLNAVAALAPAIGLAWAMSAVLLPNSPIYGEEMLAALILSNNVLPLRLCFAGIVTVLMLLLFAAVIALGQDVPRWFACLGPALFTGVATLAANYRSHGVRLNQYARTLREKLRQQDLSVLNQTLDQMAKCDTLTGLANRRAFDDWLASSWREAQRRGQTISLIAIDIDHFKAFNDFNGHPAGDGCLQTIARSLRDQLRGTGDLVARIGGEEFMVVLPGLGAESGGEIAERLRGGVEALELPHLGIGPRGLVTISVGLASCAPGAALSPTALVAAADAALYRAKQLGRNQVCAAEV